MSLPLREVSFDLTSFTGEEFALGEVTLILTPTLNTTSGGVMVPAVSATFEPDASGQVTLNLVPGDLATPEFDYRCAVRVLDPDGNPNKYLEREFGAFRVPDSAGPFVGADLLAAGIPPAETSYWRSITEADYLAAIEARDEAVAAAAILEGAAYQAGRVVPTVAEQADYPIGYDPGNADWIQVHLNGNKLETPLHYTLTYPEGVPSVTLAVAPQFSGQRLEIAGVQALAYDPNLNRVENLRTRAALVSHIDSEGAVSGQIYSDGMVFYFGSGLNDIPDLPGLSYLPGSVVPFDARGSAYTQITAPGSDEWLFTEFPADGLAGHAITVQGAGSVPGYNPATGAFSALSRVSSFGAANLMKIEAGSRLDAFGSSVMRFTKFGERNTGVGSLVMQWAGSDPTDDPNGRFYNHDILYNAGTPITDPAWDYIGLETDNPGIRATIAAWAATEPWATVSTDFERNVGVGRDTLTELIVGTNNAASGYRSLSRILEGDFNTGAGADAGGRLIFGDGNTAIGFEAMSSIQEGDNNTALGRDALHDFITGNRNIGLGYRSGWQCFGSDNNIYIGPFAGNQDAGGGHSSRIYIQPGATGYIVGDMANGSLALGTGVEFADLINNALRLVNGRLVVSTDTGNSHIRRVAGDRHELIITATDGSSYLTGSRGSAIKMYGNLDDEHPGAFTISTGADDLVDARIYVTQPGPVVMGSGIWNYSDDVNTGAVPVMGRLIIKDSFTRGENLPAIFADKVYQSTGNTPVMPQIFGGVGLREQTQDLGAGDGARFSLFVMPVGETTWTEKSWWAWEKANATDTEWAHDFTIAMPTDQSLATVPTELLRLRAVERDLLIDGEPVITKGTLTDPRNVPGIKVRLPGSSAVAADVTGVADWTAVRTIEVPAGYMGANGEIEIDVEVVLTSAATDKFLRIEYGGTVVHQTVAGTFSSTRNYATKITIQNRNDEAVQYFRAIGAANPFGNSTSTGATTGTVNSAVAQNVVISLKVDTAAEVVTLSKANVSVIYAE
jgi:hypothetical protein